MPKKIHVAALLILAIVLVQPFSPAYARDEFRLKGDERSPETVMGATSVGADQAKKLFDQGVAFIDVRKNRDWDAGRVPGAHHLELKKEFTQESLRAIIKPGEPAVYYCNGPKCLRSSKAAAKAVKWGLTKVYYFREGLPAWRKAGYPVE